jgi:hypothetical protein
VLVIGLTTGVANVITVALALALAIERRVQAADGAEVGEKDSADTDPTAVFDALIVAA